MPIPLTEETVKILSEAGGIGIAILLVLLLFYIAWVSRQDRKDFTKTIQNHSVHESGLWQRMVEVIGKNSSALQKFTDVIEEMHDTLKKNNR